MADSGSFGTNWYSSTGLNFNWWITGRDNYSNWVDIGWNIVGARSKSGWVNVRNVSMWVDGEQVAYVAGAIRVSNGTVVASGNKRIYGASNKYFTASMTASIYQYAQNASGSGGWTLPTLVVNPTIPNWISVSGGAGGTWVDRDNPSFNVSWGGATSGTYTISQYSIDVTKYGANSWANTGNYGTSAGSGSTTRNVTGIGTLNGGDKVQVRVGMMTTNGTWWGHVYWNGVLNIFSKPTAPTSFVAPSQVEIDQGFNLSWTGAVAGSNGLAGYDLQARAFNGTNWTDWTNIFLCKNQTSYSVSKIKDLEVNGVSYSKNGEGVKFQYRIRSTDNIIGVSSWKESAQIGILIYNPTTPRNNIHEWCYKWKNEATNISNNKMGGVHY